ncbi:uncharacterized protein LOC124112710 [Haliotis rufescens]|uniref:uncharacterized protein LOC124112710 n=1 Tax=Haliotis rufescens TaxID=6454 RepID=UPI001EAFDD8B|nr:uncharacterized protein LOC124112710 [Haliotis rufescens]
MWDDPRLTTTAVRFTELLATQHAGHGTAVRSALCPSSRVRFIMIYALLIVLAQTPTTSAPPTPDNDSDHLTTYLHNGHTCVKCKPGTFLTDHCTSNFKSSECASCPPDHFQTHYTRARWCQPCHAHCLHDDNMIEVKGCSATEDLACKCKEGYYEERLANGHSLIRTCFPYTPCVPGQIVVKNGTDFADQECGFCGSGHFAKGDNCVTCSSCSGNTTVLRPCDVTADVVCSTIQHVNETDVDLPDEAGDTTIVILSSIAIGIFVCGASVILIVVMIFKRKCRVQNDDSIVQTDKSNVPLLVVKTPAATATSQSTPPVTAEEARKALVKRQRSRTLSESSVVSASTQIYFPSLQDPDSWTGHIFPILCKHLTGNWKMFMRNLPGDEEYASCIDARCDQICDDIRNDTQEQIYKALREWKQAHDWPIMSVESILCSLQTIGGCEVMQKNIFDKGLKLDQKNSEKNPNN